MENEHGIHVKPSKKLILLFVVLSVLYFGVLILPNATGAKSPEMIAVFEVDEYAQYPHALQLLTSGDTIKQTLRNFLVYDHYFYGYPFYFFSGLSLIPFKWIAGSNWQSQTQTILVILRQLVGVLPNLLSVWCLTYCVTEFRNAWKSIFVFVFLLFSPGLLNNSLWWHPDAIGMLFVSLGFLGLRMDRFRFGIFYYLTAVAVGIAFGIKYMGAFFILLIPVYLLIGVLKKNLRWGKMIFLAAAFVALMLTVIVLSNPLLLLQERSAIIENQILQFTQTSQGILMGKQAFLQNGQLPQWFILNYGSIPFLLLLIAGLVAGIIKKETRVQSILLAAWVIPYTITILNTSSQRSYYWLPIFLPLMTALLPLFPDQPISQLSWWKKAWLGAISVLILFQFVWFGATDTNKYVQVLQREEKSLSLAFYEIVHSQWINNPDDSQRTLIYRDWHIYYPSDENTEVFMDWELADYALINKRQPDYLLLEKVNVVTYGAEDYLDAAPNTEQAHTMHRFYRDALLDQIEGYSLKFQNDFGMLFINDSRS